MTFAIKDTLYLFGMSDSKIYYSEYSGSSFGAEESITVDKTNCEASTDNLYEGRIFPVPPEDLKNQENYRKIFAPAGVFYRYNAVYSVVFIMSGDKETYAYEVRTSDDGDIDFSTIQDENGKAVPTSIEKNEIKCGESRYCFDAARIMMNVDKTEDSSILATYKRTKATKPCMGDDSKGIRSMSLFTPYMDPKE
jgi:hypothetical protein